MVEQYGAHMMMAGFALMAIGWLWLVVSAFRDRVGWGVAILLFPPLAPVYVLMRGGAVWAPAAVLALGLVLTAFPPLYTNLAPIDLGPRETIVEGERHLTLTGWDRKDYAFLGSKSDAVVVQIANPDVDDATLNNLKGFDKLRELDLSDTKVTDEGLKILKDLPALTTLRLANTKITDAGFKAALADKESLQRLDLTGTAVSSETVDAWKAAKPGRRAMQ
ncbi:leucine-rich repeat domain-containing protein [Paludisphaera rhizosphaerae]|uniref:leucine-rich repeat domain-containing protein n=1 Tax=Paludisphaera rhizosphaerae TaxID=2711216 RepID=UPI0019810196|nr:leucine-rich repeat domain-containing protein [Paludisphaera rhizosphaerae]